LRHPFKPTCFYAIVVSATREAKMATRQVMFTFPAEMVREPIIYILGQQFGVIPNIRQADISESKGWVVLELEGEEKDIEAGIDWLTSKGIRVDAVTGDIVEG
jgi:ABC-type methionine transport system ATPase subunit